jgi:hypothetical protein
MDVGNKMDIGKQLAAAIENHNFDAASHAWLKTEYDTSKKAVLNLIEKLGEQESSMIQSFFEANPGIRQTVEKKFPTYSTWRPAKRSEVVIAFNDLYNYVYGDDDDDDDYDVGQKGGARSRSKSTKTKTKTKTKAKTRSKRSKQRRARTRRS